MRIPRKRLRPRGRDLAGDLVLVTGAASGIGRATARALAERGSQVVLTDVQPLDGVLAEVGDACLMHRQLDLTDAEAVRAFADDVHREYGAVDVVMNIAGAAAWGTVEALTPEQWRRMVEVNLMAPIHVIHEFVPPMIRAGHGGHLVNVSSAAGIIGMPRHAAYSAGKFGLRGVSEVLRFDLRRHGIGVSLVCPGAVNTPLTDTVDIAGVDQSTKAFRAAQRHFQKSATSPEKAAEAIIRGVERNRYWVYTSADIRAIHAIQRVFPPGYNAAMRVFQRAMDRMIPEERTR